MENKQLIVDNIYALIYYNKDFVPYIKTCLIDGVNVHVLSDDQKLMSGDMLNSFKNSTDPNKKTEVILSNDTMPVEIVKFGGVHKLLKQFVPERKMPRIDHATFASYIEKGLKYKLVDGVAVTDVESVIKYEKRYNKALLSHHKKVEQIKQKQTNTFDIEY